MEKGSISTFQTRLNLLGNRIDIALSPAVLIPLPSYQREERCDDLLCGSINQPGAGPCQIRAAVQESRGERKRPTIIADRGARAHFG